MLTEFFFCSTSLSNQFLFVEFRNGKLTEINDIRLSKKILWRRKNVFKTFGFIAGIYHSRNEFRTEPTHLLGLIMFLCILELEIILNETDVVVVILLEVINEVINLLLNLIPTGFIYKSNQNTEVTILSVFWRPDRFPNKTGTEEFRFIVWNIREGVHIVHRRIQCYCSMRIL